MKTQNILKLLPVALFALGAASASAQSYWSWGHGDIGIELHGDHFHTHWGLDTGSIVDGNALSGPEEYHPEEIVAFVGTTMLSPAGSQSWLGLAAGSTVYRAGNNNYQPNLGFAANGIGDESNWVGGGLTITLDGWNANNPGNMALATSGGTVLFSTFDPAAATGSIFLGAGDHAHYNWFFTEAGYYELTFTWTGTHVTYGEVSISDTFGFQVGVVPEPSTWALIISGSSALLAVAIRRRKRA